MITLIWYIFRKEEGILREIAKGSTKAEWQRHLIYLAFVIEAVIEFTAAVKLTGLF